MKPQRAQIGRNLTGERGERRIADGRRAAQEREEIQIRLTLRLALGTTEPLLRPRLRRLNNMKRGDETVARTMATV